MTKTLAVVEARKRFTGFPDDFAKAPLSSGVTVTRRGKPVMAVLPYELYESMLETLAVLADPDLLAQLRKAEEQISAGKAKTLAQAEKELGL
jgi:PHD/YefM family antitoxin component YafN of YafNO toxin-antitoxin module